MLIDKQLASRSFKLVFWDKPPPTLFKINSDGSAKNNICGGNGVNRDCNGKFIMAFPVPFGRGSRHLAM